MNAIHPDTRIMNFTPHDIKIVDKDGTLIKSYPSVAVARVKQESKFIGFADGGTAVPFASSSVAFARAAAWIG